MDPQPLDYRAAGAPQPGRRRGSVALFVAGIVSGLGLSFLGWWAAFSTGDAYRGFWVVVALIVTKLVLAYVVDRRLVRRGLGSGVVLSIPLVPLLALGTVAVICGGMRF